MRKETKTMAFCGLLVALAFLFGYIESLIPLSLGVPGVKPGIANVVTMVSLYLLGPGTAAFISVTRVVLTGFTFGNLSMMMYSMAGALLSLAVMILLKKADILGMAGVSIAGGIAHNLGQLMVAAVVLKSPALFSYFPVLLIAGTLSGAAVGILGTLIVRRIAPLFS